MANEEKKKYMFCIDLADGVDCIGSSEEDSICFDVELSDDEVAAIRQLVKEAQASEEDDLMPILESAELSVYQRIDKAARAAMFDYFLVQSAENYDIDFDEDEQRMNFKKDLESGLFDPDEFIEESSNYSEVPEDEEELFDLWSEWENRQFGIEDAAWIRSRYTVDESQIDVSGDEYFCYIPEEFF